MNRTLGGIPIIGWVVALGAVVGGALWLKKRQAKSGASPTAAAQPAFTQAQEVQDFQIFSSLTSSQQASDLSFVSEMASLFSGGGSPTSSTAGGGAGGGGGAGTTTTTPNPGGSMVPSPAATGSAPPATVAASSLPWVSAASAAANPSSIAGNQPGTNIPNYGVQSASGPNGAPGYAPAPAAGSPFYAKEPANVDPATWLAI